MSTTSPAPPSPPLDSDVLARFLDGEHAGVRARVRELLSRPDFARPLEISRDDYRELVLTWLKEVGSTGFTALGFPEEYGGQNNTAAFVSSFETLAFGDLSLLVKVGVHFGLFGGAIQQLGTKAHHDAYLRDVISVALPGCFAMTETGHGSDVQAIGTTATYDPEAQEFVIATPHEHARKDYIGNSACHGRMAAVFAQLVVGGESHGVHCLLVRLRDDKGKVLPGIEITDDGPKLGLNGVDNGRIAFRDVRVPRENLLNRFADVSPEGEYSSAIENPNKRFFTMLGTLIQGRVSVAGASVSAAKSALTIAVRYGNRRRQFGPPDSDEETVLLDYRMHQRRLLPLLATTYALHFAQEVLVAALHQAFTGEVTEREHRELETNAAGLKAYSSWHASMTIQTCREACGGAGYLAENRFAGLKADQDVFTTFEGDNTVLLQLVAKSLLTDFRDHFGELDSIGVARFVARQFFDTVVDRTRARAILETVVDIVPTRDDDEILDRERMLDLMVWREEHVLGSLARRLKAGVDDGHDAFDVFNFTQDHVITAARAHVDRVVADDFAKAIERAPEPTRAVLGDLCDLHLLATLERERGWYLEHGRISTDRSKAITREINRLCDELRPHAGALVDGFAIPDAVLAAPIGLRDA